MFEIHNHMDEILRVFGKADMVQLSSVKQQLCCDDNDDDNNIFLQSDLFCFFPYSM